MKLGWKWWGHWEQSGGIQSYVQVDIKLFFKALQICVLLTVLPADDLGEQSPQCSY